MTEYSLGELKKLAKPALQHAELVELARTQSPSRAFDLANGKWAKRQAKAVRFLAILRRDHLETFDAFVTSMEHARPQGTEHAQGENMNSVASSTEPQFLYPISRQYPFDEVCSHIVWELEQRGWQVPGIKIEFDVYGSGEQKFRMVREIRGEDFRLYFSRIQRLMPDGKYNDTAAVNTITIGKSQITVYEDESGPTFYTYVGTNWPRDREQFTTGSKVNSKLNKKPRTYLKYSGKCFCPGSGGGVTFSSELILNSLLGEISVDKELEGVPHNHIGKRAPYLVHDNDLEREYEPLRGRWNWAEWKHEPDEPRFYRTDVIMIKFVSQLYAQVLSHIVSFPATGKVEFKAETPEPFTPLALFGDIFTFADANEEHRIRTGKGNPNQLRPADRFVSFGSLLRLVSYGNGDKTVPKIAHEGFIWCGIAPAFIPVTADDLKVPGYERPSSTYEWYVIRIKPNRANGIYIADHGEYEKRRAEIWQVAESENRNQLTNAEVTDFVSARGRTIIPISEYKGGFTQPLILIERELGFDEVEIISGPHSDRRRL